MREPAGTPGQMVTKGQIQLIKIGQKELGMEDEDYRDLLMRLFRASSCTQLTIQQATRLIEHFESLGFETKNHQVGNQNSRRKCAWTSRPAAPSTRSGIPRQGGNVVRLASQAEQNKIAALSSLISWQYEDGLSRWLKKRFGVNRVRTAREAFLAIEGLKKMFSNAMAKEHGEDWWCMEFGDEGVRRFIKEHRPSD